MFGVHEAAWPLIRHDLHLSYIQIGILLGVPGLVSTVVEPVLGILSDVWRRRALILGGGLFYGLMLSLMALSGGFWPFLIATLVLFPASGAFVSLSQAALMDTDTDRHEQNMARWTFAGSLGVVAGPLVLGGALLIGLGWRGLFVGLGLLAFGLTLLTARLSFPPNGLHDENGEALSFRGGLYHALRALRRGRVIRWIVLLQFSDLMLDVLLSFLALYFVDVVGISTKEAGLAVALWSIVGLLGDFLLIPLLERVRGLSYLRISAAIMLVLFPAFLLMPVLPLKLALLAVLGFLNSGWYAILQAGLYSEMPGQGGTAVAITNVGTLLGSLILLGLGVVAQVFGLEAAMWLLLAGPVALLIGLPRSPA